VRLCQEKRGGKKKKGNACRGSEGRKKGKVRSVLGEKKKLKMEGGKVASGHVSIGGRWGKKKKGGRMPSTRKKGKGKEKKKKGEKNGTVVERTKKGGEGRGKGESPRHPSFSERGWGGGKEKKKVPSLIGGGEKKKGPVQKDGGEWGKKKISSAAVGKKSGKKDAPWKGTAGGTVAKKEKRGRPNVGAMPGRTRTRKGKKGRREKGGGEKKKKGKRRIRPAPLHLVRQSKREKEGKKRGGEKGGKKKKKKKGTDADLRRRTAISRHKKKREEVFTRPTRDRGKKGPLGKKTNKKKKGGRLLSRVPQDE